MKKIDLHLHTICTVSDNNFEFSMDTLKKYVSDLEIDCIAITNHNVFNLGQYKEITEELEIKVFPGIEIDLEGGHLLLISDDSEIYDFAQKCQRVSDAIPTSHDSISVEELVEIYPDLTRYLLIPHYDKKPCISEETLQKLKDYINTGEVTSPKKFQYRLKQSEALVPVLFSDLRMKETLSSFPTRQTYVDIGDITLSSLKHALSDKNKVFLAAEDGHFFFDALDNGLKLSTGLNVLLGERSTGKSYTLDRIYEEYENTKYIKQFALLERDQAADIKKFNESLSKGQSILTRNHLTEIQLAVDDILEIDIDHDERNIERYVSSLIQNAQEAEKADSYSKTQLFSESAFSIGNEESLKTLISSTVNLIENTEYREIIDRNISIGSLKKLAIELMQKCVNETELRLKRQFVNDVIDSIQTELRIHTAATPICEIDLYDIAMDRAKVAKFNEVISSTQSPKVILKKEIQGYEIVASRRAFNGAQELKSLSGKQLTFSTAFESYDEPYRFVMSLKDIGGLEEADYYKYLVKVEYQILNKHGYQVSGGERSEFRLLQEISDAQQFDMLLIDEPESSFDNVFLMNKVNTLIKDISKNMPVVLVTHNSTVGASIKPDYVLYTQKELINDEMEYDIFTGYPADKQLTGLSGNIIPNHQALLNCLEAGEQAYKDRGSSYEILKD